MLTKYILVLVLVVIKLPNTLVLDLVSVMFIDYLKVLCIKSMKSL